MLRHKLYTGEMESIVRKHLAGKSSWIEGALDFGPTDLGMSITYFYNQEKNAVLISSPLTTNKADNSDIMEPVYQDAVKRLSDKLVNRKFRIIGSLLFKGAVGGHYVAFHQSFDGKMSIFDSQISNPYRLLNPSNTPSFIEGIWIFITNLFHIIGSILGYRKKINSTIAGNNVEMYMLGTQSLFDRVSCGLHSCGAVLVMADCIDNNLLSDVELTTAILSGKRMDLKAERLLGKPNAIPEIPLISPFLSVFKRGSSQLEKTQEDNEISDNGVDSSSSKLGQEKATDNLPVEEEGSHSLAGWR